MIISFKSVNSALKKPLPNIKFYTNGKAKSTKGER